MMKSEKKSPRLTFVAAELTHRVKSRMVQVISPGFLMNDSWPSAELA
jgi:hypothetical protein